MKKIITILCVFLSVIFIVLGFISPVIIKHFVIIDGLKLNEITTWLTGSMSTCFSLSSIFLVIGSLNLNYENIKKSQFENRFFKWNELFKSVKNNLTEKYLNDIVNELDLNLDKIDYRVYDSSSMHDVIYDTDDCYKELFEKEKYKLGEYISCLYNLIKFVEDGEVSRKEKGICMEFVRANLSVMEKKIVFYHSFSNKSGKGFHDIIEKYQMLLGLQEKDLVHGKLIIDLYYKRNYNE